MKAESTYIREDQKIELSQNETIQYEKLLQLLEEILEMTNNSEDYRKVQTLGYNLYKNKLDDDDINSINELTDKYLFYKYP